MAPSAMDAADENADGAVAQSEPDPQSSQEHKSLKYSLLGPSLLKAGQDAVDQRQVSEIIYNASKGSKFFNHEEQKDKILTQKIEQILARKARLDRLDLSADCRRADEFLAELEATRDLSQTVVHVDCDAFFAAVEELDRPELKTVPMAVGKGVLTTCNYVARKYGCRSGMAGFVARKLCPQLICLPQNFEKYGAKAEEVRAILVEYDPCFESASIDEAYLNITAYCDENNIDPQEAVQQMRARIAEETKITVSAGIAANAKLAKIASNQNKPNGQFYIPPDRQEIMSFMKNLPVRKVNGIGRVFERELKAIGIETCGDIYSHRASLKRLFGEKAFQFLMQCYLGLGRTKIQPPDESERKSVGTESTFSDMGDREAIRAKLRWTAEELEKDLARTQYKGRTLVLKVKLHTFEVYTRQVVPPKAVSRADDLYAYALPILAKLEKEIPNMRLRLMGLRCTNLVSTKKGGLNLFGFQSIPKSSTSSSADAPRGSDNAISPPGNEIQLGTEQDFENAARQEREDELDELEKLTQEEPNDYKEAVTVLPTMSADNNDNPTPNVNASGTATATVETPDQETEHWTCPICSKLQPADDKRFNEHVDYCLSKGTILAAVQSSAGTESSTSPLLPAEPSSRKRKSSSETDVRQRRLFFA